MTEIEWITCDYTEPMLTFLRSNVTARKLMLFVVACRRRLFDLDGTRFTFKQSPEDQEQQAEDSRMAEAVKPTDYLTEHANQYAEGFAWAAHFDLKGCSDQPFAPVARKFDVVQATQCVILREIVGNPFRPVSLKAAWQTPNVLALATATYDDRVLPARTLSPARLAVLADALEEAGCENADILNHLREPGEHVRGCWVVDMLLGKE